MTIGGAIAELQNLLEADDVPFYYKGGIQKVIETIQMELRAEQTEPQMGDAKPIPLSSRITKTEPSTDGYMTKEQTKEYNDMLKEHSTVMGNITDCSWK